MNKNCTVAPSFNFWLKLCHLNDLRSSPGLVKHFPDGDSVNSLRAKFIWENIDIYSRFIWPLAAEMPHGVEIHPQDRHEHCTITKLI